MAVMVHEGLFVGNGHDVYGFNGSILHCARDPWFAKVANLVPSDSPFRAPRPFGKTWIRISYNEMALNMVDAERPDYFPDEMINVGLDFISERFADGDPVLCHCNQGLSRSPSIAFLWMWEHGFLDDEFRYALPQFRNLYTDYCPGNGIFEYVKNRCENE